LAWFAWFGGGGGVGVGVGVGADDDDDTLGRRLLQHRRPAWGWLPAAQP